MLPFFSHFNFICSNIFLFWHRRLLNEWVFFSSFSSIFFYLCTFCRRLCNKHHDIDTASKMLQNFIGANTLYFGSFGAIWMLCMLITVYMNKRWLALLASSFSLGSKSKEIFGPRTHLTLSKIEFKPQKFEHQKPTTQSVAAVWNSSRWCKWFSLTCLEIWHSLNDFECEFHACDVFSSLILGQMIVERPRFMFHRKSNKTHHAHHPVISIFYVLSQCAQFHSSIRLFTRYSVAYE